jgi:hypothetical protein
VQEVLTPEADEERGPATAPVAHTADLMPDDTIRIGLEDVRGAERQHYQRRLRKTMARMITEADVRVRAAVQEVEMSYLTELENKHRQVLELKRKVALQQREIWKLQKASLRQTNPSEPGDCWPPEVSPDSI